MLGQLIGMFGAAFIATIITAQSSGKELKLVAPRMASEQSGIQEMAIEGIGSMIIVLVFLMGSINVRTTRFVFGIVMGSVYCALKICFIQRTGGCFNLTELLAPVFVFGKVENLTLYLFGQIIGGLVGLLCYQLFLNDHEPRDFEKEEEEEDEVDELTEEPSDIELKEKIE